jgi:uncharacterized protein (DUF58 family)
MLRGLLRRAPITRGLLTLWQDKLTGRGRFLLAASAVFALLGLDTAARSVYVLFAAAAGLLTAAAVLALRRPPRAAFACLFPDRATAGTPVRFSVRVVTDGARPAADLFLSVPRERHGPEPLRVWPRETFLSAPEGRAEVALELCAPRRGRYELVGPRLRRTDPLGLMTSAAVRHADQALLVYPRFYAMEDLDVPLGRRYQPGGIPLSSSTGDAIEFVGTREYREGDPVKNIHWRSWSRW